jgi:ABC-2 type transport system permease protein
MTKAYSQCTALLAIARASLRAILRSPSAVIFSFGFPLIFILVFGFLSETKPTVKIGFTADSDKSLSNPLYQAIQNHPLIRVVGGKEQELRKELEKGRITALISIHPTGSSHFPRYIIRIVSSSAGADKKGLLESVLRDLVFNFTEQNGEVTTQYAEIKQAQILPGRVYKTIDFILPGQLGFSLLSAGVFGVAFVFFNLRQTLVLKRFFATPISRAAIILGEGLARVSFQLTTAMVILLIGYFVFDFTLINGWITFFELLLLSAIGLIVFMGFGFVVSGLARNESMIPPFANMITLPQFLLAGTFFSIDAFPVWLQPVCRLLPLTHLNNAMRNVAFEGIHLINCGKEIAVLLIWGLLIYGLAVKVFKWES